MSTAITRHNSTYPRTHASPSAMAAAGGLHPFGVLVLLAGAFLPIADFFIVNVALPTIDRTMNASAPTLELIVAGYGIAYAAVLVLGGRLGDRYGRRRLFLGGLVGFMLASLACGIAPDIQVLIGARVVQGAAAAMLVPQVLATCHAALEGERKARALALYGSASGIAAVVGQLAGGLLVHADIAGTSWRPIFLINIPLGLLVLVAALRVVPATKSERAVGIDLAGTVLFAATLVALLVPLTEGHDVSWPVWTWALLAASVILAAVTFVVEQRSERRGNVPLLPPSLLKLPSMWRGLALILPFSMAFGSFMFVFALTAQDGLHYSALKSGLAILPMAAMFLLGSIFSPRVIARYGRGAMATAGLVQVAGLASLIAVMIGTRPHTTMLDLALPLAVNGACQSVLFTGLFRVVLRDVPPHHAGIGGGALITLQQSGLALGVATLGTLYLALEPRGATDAFAWAVGVQAVLVALVVAGTRMLPKFTE